MKNTTEPVIDPTEVLPVLNAKLLRRPMPASGAAVSDVVQWFLDYYWVRHAISPETLASYRADLQELERWLAVHGKSLVAASSEDLREFLQSRYRTGYRVLNDVPSLTCIKRFYSFLVTSGLLPEDPTERVFVRTPAPLRREPSLVTENQAQGRLK